MTAKLATVVLVAVVVVVGGSGYAVLSATSGTESTTVTRCSPFPDCYPPGLAPDDLELFVVYQTGYGQVGASLAQEQSLPATVAVTDPEAASLYNISWGDGSNYVGASPSASHVYSGLGSYIVSAEALEGSTWHYGTKYLFPIVVTPDLQTSLSEYYPTVATKLTDGSSGAAWFGWLEGSGSIDVSAAYTANSTAVGLTDQAPRLTSTGGVQSGLVSTPTSVAASYAFDTPGLYYITMVGAITAPSGPIYQNYTWTVYVSPEGLPVMCTECTSGPLHSVSPHPGRVTWQEVVPGGATSEDPSVAYDSISAEPIYNVYQTLVAYNGASTSSFVPELSTCVPGDAGADSCQAIYEDSLIANDPATSLPRYWTFPIDKVARFFDPVTRAEWSVYPSDVAFTLARTCGFADLPGVGSEPGWIACQALLANGSSEWDGAIHAPYNNTPQNVLSSMLINDSTYCPANVLADSNGCITFDASGGGQFWSFFLQLVADPLGAAIEPCGWYTAQGAGVPGFAGASAANGDGSCYLPGPAGSKITSTSEPTFQSWVQGLSPTYWDSFDMLSLNTPAIQLNVRWNMVGSGPYYLATMPFTQSVGYTLEQNPAYQAPTGCQGQLGCEPLPGPSHYVANVTVVYRSSDTTGIEQYQAGETDFATILPGETPEMLALIAEGKIGALSVPTLNTYALAFALKFNVSLAKSVDPNIINVPGDFFNYVGLRQFLVNAFPYTTVENTIFTTDGIQYGFNYGGAIPQYMGNYYPTNISWPSGDPVTNPSVNGSAAWWWAQATTSGSPYYDPELAACTTSSPCRFPIVGEEGVTYLDQALEDYLTSIDQISGGAVAPDMFHFGYGWCGSAFQPGCGPLPMVAVGHGPDYPDPTDFVLPLYYPNATFTMADAVQQGLDESTCPNQGPTPSGNMMGLVYWANHPAPQACQGNAYTAMEWGMSTAAPLANGPERVLLYNLVEHIANGLALYVYYDQENEIVTYATWINPMSINTNPMIGGAGDNTWYLLNGNDVLT